jgi:hypothetical protein
MPTTLTAKANDKSTYVVTVAFTDEDGVAAIPTAINWTLTNSVGAVINSRSNVSVATPATSVDILLGALDLDYDEGRRRVLTIQATYNSSLGTGLPLKDQVEFAIDNLLMIT